jgi:hypothetical protein
LNRRKMRLVFKNVGKICNFRDIPVMPLSSTDMGSGAPGITSNETYVVIDSALFGSLLHFCSGPPTIHHQLLSLLVKYSPITEPVSVSQPYPHKFYRSRRA